MAQAQFSLREQLEELRRMANKSGLYDASDWITSNLAHLNSPRKGGAGRDTRRTWSGHWVWVPVTSMPISLESGHYAKADYAPGQEPIVGGAVTVREVG